jgi:hypothetical protein
MLECWKDGIMGQTKRNNGILEDWNIALKLIKKF